MGLEAKEIPTLLFWFMMMGVSSYAMIKIAGKVREQVANVFE